MSDGVVKTFLFRAPYHMELHGSEKNAYIFPMVKNHLLKYTEAMPDVMNSVLATLNSTSSVEPPADASNNILYYQLYEELKTLL